MRNPTLKLFSLLIAILLFLFVNSDANTSVTEFSVPIELRNLPKERILIAPLGRQIRITVKGPSSLVTRLASAPPVLRVELPQDLGNRYIASLRAEDLSLPPYVQVQKVDPAELEFTFDNLITRQVPVNVPRIGTVPENLVLEDFLIDPEVVTLTGPESEVKAVTEVVTYPLDLRGQDRDINQDLAVRAHGALTEVIPSSIRVAAKVSTIKSVQSFSRVAVEIRSTIRRRFIATPEFVSVQVSGAASVLKELKQEQLLPYVRVKEQHAEKREYPVLVELPDGVTLIKAEPASITLSEIAESSVVRPSGRK